MSFIYSKIFFFCSFSAHCRLYWNKTLSTEMSFWDYLYYSSSNFPSKGFFFLSHCSAKHNETVPLSPQCILCIKLALLLLYWFYWSDLGCNNLSWLLFDFLETKVQNIVQLLSDENSFSIQVWFREAVIVMRVVMERDKVFKKCVLGTQSTTSWAPSSHFILESRQTSLFGRYL